MFESIRKEGIRFHLDYRIDPSADKLAAKPRETLAKLVSRPQLPNSSSISLIPGKPTDSKILKRKSSSDTHVLTLLISDGSVEKLKMENAYGLDACDLQDLLNLDLERDIDDMISLDIELQFKGQIREMLMRNKGQQ
ncbi:hypothetical protein Hanom_Chr05g00448001 [Helianthus anomalus]